MNSKLSSIGIGNPFPVLLAVLCLSAASGPSSGDTSNAVSSEHSSQAPLDVQTESDYVTDPNRWGNLIYDPSGIEFRGGSDQDALALSALIEKYHRAWLLRDSESMKGVLDPQVSRFRQGQLRSGLAGTLQRIKNESRGERPEGQLGSTQLTVRNVELDILGNTATAFYRVDIHTGARWEYADLATVFQVFRKTKGDWRILHHVETTELNDPHAPDLPESVPSRRAPFVLDFVYPVEDLQRATTFYSLFLGEPEHILPDRAIFRLRDSRFELEAKPFDERITIKKGAGNGYGVINVPDIASSQKALIQAGASRISPPRACGPDLCIMAEDPSGNVIMWRERRPSISPQAVRPSVSLDISANAAAALMPNKLFQSWTQANRVAVLSLAADHARWIDDFMANHPLAVAQGRQEIGPALEARWGMLDRGPDGLSADLEIRDLRELDLGNRRIVSFDLIYRFRGAHPSTEHAFVSQIWTRSDGIDQLENSFIAKRRQPFDRPVSSMDYTAYPLNDLGRDGRFYKTVLGSEPYRDENWFGFWSASSVFGMFEKDSETTPFRPYPHRNNGYADLNIRSANETLRLLTQAGAPLPHVPGINNQPGIDPNPGYNQILAVDPEGNLINFSEYLEY